MPVDPDRYDAPFPGDEDARVEAPEKPISTKAECERFLIHALLVAGKTATFGNTKTELLLTDCQSGESPFDYLRRLLKEGRLRQIIETVKTGNYTKMEAAFTALANSQLDVQICSYEELRKIHGIGPKTANYFLMYSRPDLNDEHAVVLDRHTLRWLRENGYANAPTSSPQDDEEYLYWSKAFFREARKHKMTVREADTFAWNKYSKNEDKGRARALKTIQPIQVKANFGKKYKTQQELVDEIRKQTNTELDKVLKSVRKTIGIIKI